MQQFRFLVRQSTRFIPEMVGLVETYSYSEFTCLYFVDTHSNVRIFFYNLLTQKWQRLQQAPPELDGDGADFTLDSKKGILFSGDLYEPDLEGAQAFELDG